MSDLALKVDGKVHSGWEQIRVSQSLEQLSMSFELSLSARWDDSDNLSPILVGTTAQIIIDDELVVTGYVDEISPAYKADEHTVTVSGRSKTGDLIDCSGEGKQYNNKSLTEIAADVCKPFGISVTDDAAASDLFRLVTIDAGESYFEFLSRLAAIRAVRLQTDAPGNLIITRVGKKQSEYVLELGVNILSASGHFSQRDRYSEYTIQGQQPGDEVVWGQAAAHISARVNDARVKRYRPTLIMADGVVTKADCKAQGQWQRNANFGRGLSVVYTVLDWTDGSKHWSPNTLIPVRDSFLGIDDLWLIVGVQLILDDQGERTELQVMPPAAFDLTDLPEPDQAATSLWGQ